MVTDQEIERDPIMMRLAVLARDNVWAHACLNSYRYGYMTREEALIECIEHMAADNKRLFEMASRAMERIQPTIVLKWDGKGLAEETLKRGG